MTHRAMFLIVLSLMLMTSMGVFAAPAANDVVFNEVQADPDDDSFISAWATGYDDITDYGTGEFVELLNRTGADVDISGWIVSGSSVPNFFTFPGAPGSSTTVIGPDERVLLVAGGAELDSPGGPAGSLDILVGVGGSSTLLVYDQAFELGAPSMGLTNSAQTLSLIASPSGTVVDEVSYGTATAGEALANGDFVAGSDLGDDAPGIRVPDGNIGSDNGDAWVENRGDNVTGSFAPMLTVLRDNVQAYPEVVLRSREQGSVAGPLSDPSYSETGAGWADIDAEFITNVSQEPARGLPLSSDESRRTTTPGDTATFAPSAAVSPEFALPSALGVYEISYIYPAETTTGGGINDVTSTLTVASVNEGAVVTSAPQQDANVAGVLYANEEFRPVGNFCLDSATAAATITATTASGTFASAVRFRELQDDAQLRRSTAGSYTIDGSVAEWLALIPAGGIDATHLTGQIQRSRTMVNDIPGVAAQLINRDDLNDDVGSGFGDVGGYFYPTDASFSPANNDCDINELRFAWDLDGLYFMLDLQDIQTNWVPFVCMTFDTNNVTASGELFYGGFADCAVSPGLAWERQLAFSGTAGTGGGGNPALYGIGFVDFATAQTVVSQDLAGSAYEGFIPWADLGFVSPPTTGDQIKVTCAVGMESFGNLREPVAGAPAAFDIGGGLSTSDETDPDFFDLAFGVGYPQYMDLTNNNGPSGGIVNVSEVRSSFGLIIFQDDEVPVELSTFTQN